MKDDLPSIIRKSILPSNHRKRLTGETGYEQIKLRQRFTFDSFEISVITLSVSTVQQIIGSAGKPRSIRISDTFKADIFKPSLPAPIPEQKSKKVDTPMKPHFCHKVQKYIK